MCRCPCMSRPRHQPPARRRVWRNRMAWRRWLMMRSDLYLTVYIVLLLCIPLKPPVYLSFCNIYCSCDYTYVSSCKTSWVLRTHANVIACWLIHTCTRVTWLITTEQSLTQIDIFGVGTDTTLCYAACWTDYSGCSAVSHESQLLPLPSQSLRLQPALIPLLWPHQRRPCRLVFRGWP